MKLLLTVVTLAVMAMAVGGSPQKRAAFDPSGSFWIQGTPPKEFENFSGINLNPNHNKRMPGSGVDLTDGAHLRFKTVSVSKRKFTFTTVAVHEVYYSFNGRFLKGGVFAESLLDDQTPVLEGTLVKWRRGRKLGEAELKFTYFGGT
jgi:hypothetical protein